MRKGEGGERRVARMAVQHFLPGPGDEPLALVDEMRAQCIGGMRFHEDGFLLARDIEIDERDAKLREAKLLA